MSDPIVIPCEGSRHPVHDHGHALGICRMCGQMVVTEDDGLAYTHDRRERVHCAGRLAVAHDRTPMVGGRCPVCGEIDNTPCRVVIAEQRGESVECRAVEAIHGDALGMVYGHLFQAEPQDGDA